MEIDGPIEQSPNKATNESFTMLMQEVRAGNLDAFILVTKFSARYKMQVPEIWAQAAGTNGCMGSGTDVLQSLDQAVRMAVTGLDEKERLNIGLMLMSAALGSPPPRVIQMNV